MPNMDLNAFYRHSLDWKHQQERPPEIEEKYEESIQQSWKEIAAVIRGALPIQGMTIHETYAGQFNELPPSTCLFDIDCVLDPFRKDAVEHGKGELIPGVIRARVYWDDESADPKWVVCCFAVLQNRNWVEFEHAQEAFIVAYETLQLVSKST